MSGARVTTAAQRLGSKRERGRQAAERFRERHGADYLAAARRRRYLLRRHAEKALARAWNLRNRQRHIERSRAWQTAHPERVREFTRRWRATHPAERRAQESRRRAIKAGSGGRHTGAEWRALVARFGGRCAYCSVTPVGRLHRDHDLPISRGGSDDIANIAPACARCNLRKGTMTGAEFRARLAREAAA